MQLKKKNPGFYCQSPWGEWYTSPLPVLSCVETLIRKKAYGKFFAHALLEHEFDEGIGLNYAGARFYDPDIAMWISPDPMRQFHSPYSYTGNGINPINGMDPDGNYFETEEGYFVFDSRSAGIPEYQGVVGGKEWVRYNAGYDRGLNALLQAPIASLKSADLAAWTNKSGVEAAFVFSGMDTWPSITSNDPGSVSQVNAPGPLAGHLVHTHPTSKYGGLSPKDMNVGLFRPIYAVESSTGTVYYTDPRLSYRGEYVILPRLNIPQRSISNPRVVPLY